ncbi:hypothetical protein [Cryobacterium suzukii]|uniref:hypothetical protein n=1 Tax=Cryobacterium suzukii TaxID=1259198 RepID=UPI00141B687E|nr:hypothetical protein [Cryobacterium suzukii]
MSNSENVNPFERFLRTMEKLPMSPGLVFHGLPSGGASLTGNILLGVVAASRNPRVATENFTTPAVACVVSRTGRLLAPFSAFPAEEEIVLLPGIVLLPVLSYRSDAAGVDVVVLEELDLEAPVVDSDREAASAVLRRDVDVVLAAAWNAAPVVVNTPGKFVVPLPL